MPNPRVSAGGGLAALFYVLKKSREAGGLFKMYRRLSSRNTCKTCAFGMGGQAGGMVNEAGHFPEVCKKSVQAQAGDMQGTIPESYFRERPIAALENLTSREAEALGRLAFPVMAEDGDTHFRRISWDNADARIARALKATPPERAFFYASGRSSNEAAYLLQLVARAYGTANVHNCSYYCHSASGVALGRVYGSGTASVVLDDLDKTDLVFLAGANPASNHPRLMTKLMQLRRRGGRVIVVNPLRELGLDRFRVPSDWRSMIFGSTMNDLYLQPHVGTDIALFKAILTRVREMGGAEQTYIDDHTTNWDAVARDLDSVSFDELASICGVPKSAIDSAARLICEAGNGVCLWAMGLTHHEHGVDNILALTNIALARGWLGRPGAGLMPIRGHSNVQGVGSVGVSPQLKEAFAYKMERLFSIRIPRVGGQDTFASMQAAHAGEIDAAVLMGGNLWGSNPNLAWAGESMRRIGTTYSMTTKLNPGHLHGRGKEAIIVPVLARDEESEKTTQESMFNFVRLSDGGAPALDGEFRSEVAIIATLAEAVLQANGSYDWSSLRSHARLREAMAATVPGYESIAAIEKDGEFQIPGRTYHDMGFSTPDGKAHFHATPLPAFAPKEGEFRLMTLRSEGQFNTVVYDEEDLYRGTTRRDVVMMAEADAKSLSLREDDRVHVVTEVGRMQVRVAIVPITPGNLAMYYPEANAIVPARLDAASRTPAFKSVIARLETVTVERNSVS